MSGWVQIKFEFKKTITSHFLFLVGWESLSLALKWSLKFYLRQKERYCLFNLRYSSVAAVRFDEKTKSHPAFK